VPKAKILKMPRRTERLNGESLSDPALPPPPANMTQLRPDAEEEAVSAARIAKWLALADEVLLDPAGRKKA
jgi:hypothetical protein